MKVLLVYPEYPATFWSFKYALPFVDKKASLPPLGLLTVASILPAAWEKKLVDMNARELTDADILWADRVFVSGMIVQKKSAQEVISRAKALGKFVVAGGPLFSTAQLDFHDIDCYILDEGEITIPMFLSDLDAGAVKHVYRSPIKPDVSKTPIPDWSLIRSKDYASLAIQISRGCPFNCDFCDVIVLNGRVPRVKEADQVMAEFDAIYNLGWRGSVFVVDDNFIGNKAKVKEILKKIIPWMEEKKRPFTLYTEASINLADEKELLELMQRANFDCVFVGIETPDEDALKSCGKVQNTGKDLSEKVKILQRSGLQVQAGFILGFDTDNHRTFDNMVKFIQKSGIVTAMVGLLHALPETTLYKRLHDAGRMLKEHSTGNNTDFQLNFVPEMDSEKLVDGYKKVLSSIFAPKNYYARIRTFIKEYKKSSRSPELPLRIKLKALFGAFWKLGIIGKGKRYFWGLLVWLVVRKPLLFPDAIGLAIYGFHFRAVLNDNIKKAA
jgi:radical SAM superfamily enzyme YgiQ (UPF0313 family)